MDGAHAAARVVLRQRDRAGQRQLPQISPHTTIGRAGRLPTALPLTLQPRSQSHRKTLGQSQATLATDWRIT